MLGRYAISGNTICGSVIVYGAIAVAVGSSGIDLPPPGSIVTGVQPAPPVIATGLPVALGEVPPPTWTQPGVLPGAIFVAADHALTNVGLPPASWTQPGVLPGTIDVSTVPINVGEVPPSSWLQSGVVPGAIEVSSLQPIDEIPPSSWLQVGVQAPPEEIGILVVGLLPNTVELPPSSLLLSGVIPGTITVSLLSLLIELPPPNWLQLGVIASPEEAGLLVVSILAPESNLPPEPWLQVGAIAPTPPPQGALVLVVAKYQTFIQGASVFSGVVPAPPPPPPPPPPRPPRPPPLPQLPVGGGGGVFAVCLPEWEKKFDDNCDVVIPAPPTYADPTFIPSPEVQAYVVDEPFPHKEVAEEEEPVWTPPWPKEATPLTNEPRIVIVEKTEQTNVTPTVVNVHEHHHHHVHQHVTTQALTPTVQTAIAAPTQTTIEPQVPDEQPKPIVTMKTLLIASGLVGAVLLVGVAIHNSTTEPPKKIKKRPRRRRRP